MYTVGEVAEKLNVSKVTIYTKLKKYKDRVAIKQGKSYIDEELLRTIKDELRIKDIDTDNFNKDNNTSPLNSDISRDNSELININKELTNNLIDQLKQKDKQIDELHDQIAELHKLIENSQILLKEEQKQNTNQLQLEEHIKQLDNSLDDVRTKMEQRKEQNEKKGFFKRRVKK
jgi:DNA anti-recombination protein RmuC